MVNIDFNSNKVIFSDDMLIKLNYLVKKEKVIHNELKYVDNNTLKLASFEDMMKIIINCFESRLNFLPEENNKINFNTENLKKLVYEYEQLNSNFIFDIGLGYYNGKVDNNNKIENIPQMITIIYQINKEIDKYYLLRDLIDAKEDIVKDMRYFLDEEAINKFNNEYQEAIEHQDTTKMNNMLLHIQDMILKEWEDFYSDIDSMTDENFCFLGHSTGSNYFKGDFYSKYVSTSLFNQNLTDTYRAAFGFIFAPKKIVGANSSDMYVHNYVDDSDMLLMYTSVKKIAHPKRVIEETLKQREKNIKDNETRIVYNEVVLEGFEPIGIFCFTNGSKGYNFNYNSAHKLQKSFPHLKVYDFDIMKNKTGDELIASQINLINKLLEQLTNYTYKVDKDNLNQYEMFLNKFNQLKQKGDYKEEEIKEIFDENIRMLSIFDTDPDKLFSGIFTNEQIKYILTKNYRYNIESILKGEINLYMIEKLKELYPYKDRLNDYFDGLSEFIEIINKISITEEMLEEINSKESLNFYTLSKYLYEEIKEKNTIKINSLNTELENDKTEYNILMNELNKRKEQEDSYNYYIDVYLNKSWYEFIKKEYKDVTSNLDIYILDDESLNLQLSNINEEIMSKRAIIESLNTSNYKNSPTYHQINESIDSLILELSKLKKHPFKNRRKIKDIKMNLKKLNNQQQVNDSNHTIYKEENIRKLNNDILELESKIPLIKKQIVYKNENINRLKNELENINNKIREYFKCNSVDEIEKQIKRAQIVVGEHDIMNEYYIRDVNNKLEKLRNIILQKEQNISIIVEENKDISRKI